MLKRLLMWSLIIAILGVGVAYWVYACAPQGRVRTVFCEFRGDSDGLRAWLLRHGLIKSEIAADVTAQLEEQKANLPDEQFLRLAVAVVVAEQRLIEIGEDGAPAVYEELNNPAGESWYLARRVVSLYGWKAAKPLAAILGDQERGIDRVQCALLLGRIGCKDPVLLPALERALVDQDSDVRVAAAISLAGYQRSEGVGILRKAIAEKGSWRQQAASALMWLGIDEGLKALLEDLRSSNNAARACAAYELGQHVDKRAVKPLIDLLNDHAADESPRARAAEALGWLDDSSAIPSLREALDDPSEVVRKAATTALRRLEIATSSVSGIPPRDSSN